MRQAAGDRSIETVLEAATILGVIGLDRWKVATLGGAIDTYRLLLVRGQSNNPSHDVLRPTLRKHNILYSQFHRSPKNN